MKTKADPAFDCLEFKASAQAEVVKDLRGKTPAEQIAYFREHARRGPFADWLARVEADMARRKGAAA